MATVISIFDSQADACAGINPTPTEVQGDWSWTLDSKCGNGVPVYFVGVSDYLVNPDGTESVEMDAIGYTLSADPRPSAKA